MNKDIILNIILGFLLIICIYFAIIWLKNDTSGESGFAIIMGIFIPIIFYLKKKDKNTYEISLIRKNIYLKRNSRDIIDINYPLCNYSDNSFIQDKINKLILFIYLRHHIDIKNEKILIDNLGEFHSDFEQVYKQENLLSIKFNNFTYYSGAAHGNVENVILNINLDTAEEFEFKDIFRSYSKNIINDLVKEKLLQKNSKNDYFHFDDIQVRDNQDFYLYDNKLYIIFFKYEIAAGCYGPIEIDINFEEIIDYINPNSPMNFLVQKYKKNINLPREHTMLFRLNLHKKLNKKM